MTENQKLREAFEQGWKMAAEWSLSDHLLADTESPAYLKERDCRLQALALPTASLDAATAEIARLRAENAELQERIDATDAMMEARK